MDDQPLQIDGPFPTKNDSSLSLETLLDPTKIKILLEWTSVPSVGMSHFPLQRRSGLNIYYMDFSLVKHCPFRGCLRWLLYMYARMARVPFWRISVPQRVGFSIKVPLMV